jgi:hypothetical protein
LRPFNRANDDIGVGQGQVIDALAETIDVAVSPHGADRTPEFFAVAPWFLFADF